MNTSQTTMDTIFWSFATFEKSLNSTQVKWLLISTIKIICYDLPCSFPKLQTTFKIVLRKSLVDNILSRNKTFVVTAKTM